MTAFQWVLANLLVLALILTAINLALTIYGERRRRYWARKEVESEARFRESMQEAAKTMRGLMHEYQDENDGDNMHVVIERRTIDPPA